VSNGLYDVNTLRTFALIYPDEIFGNHGQVVLFQQATRLLDAEDFAIMGSGSIRTEAAGLVR